MSLAAERVMPVLPVRDVRHALEDYRRGSRLRARRAASDVTS